MKINIVKLQDIIKKSTINYINNFCQLNIDKQSIKCSLNTTEKTALSILNVKNDIILDMKDDEEWIWNWAEPNTEVIPYMQLFDNEIIDFEFKNNNSSHGDVCLYLKDKQLKTKINFSQPIYSNIYQNKNTSEHPYFTSVLIDDSFLLKYNKVKKIANRTEKLYFSIDNDVLFVESGDKTNKFSNSVKIELDEITNKQPEHPSSFSLAFNCRNFMSLMSVIDVDILDYTLSFSFSASKKLGALKLESSDKSEKFFLMSYMEA